MSKFTNMMYVFILFSASYCFAQSQPPSPDTNAVQPQALDIKAVLQNIEDKLSQAVDESKEQNGNITLLIRTEEDKLIRFACPYQNCKGTELNSKITKALLSSGRYESQNELVPELGIQCQKLTYALSKDNKIAIGYGENCQRGS